MKTIWKFELPITDEAELMMPAGAVVLDVKPFYTGVLNVWAVVDPAAPEVPHRFSIRGTGHPLGTVGKHVATASDGRFVWHVFEAS